MSKEKNQEIKEENSLEIRKGLYNIEAEQAILGTIILNNEYLNRVIEFLRAEHFYEPAHQKIYEQIIHNVENVNIVANQVTLKQFFESNENIKAIGGEMYLSTLLASASGIIDIADYGKIVSDLALKRELAMIGEDVVNRVYKTDENSSAQEQIEAAEGSLFKLSEHGDGKKDFAPISASLKTTLDKTLIAKERGSDISGVSTGLIDLDNILGGMQPSDLIILAGRPSMGKAQPLDSNILMQDGNFKKMGDIKIGDKLASIDGKESQVSGIFPQGSKETYEITFSDGRSTRCCAQHLWRIHNRKWKDAKILNTHEIISLLEKDSYKRRLWVDQISGEFGEDKNLPIDPWLLGVLLGDGKISSGSILFSSASQDIIKQVADRSGELLTLKYAGKYDYRIVQSGGAKEKGVFGVRPNPLKEKLKDLNLFGTHSDTKFIPEQYLKSSRNSRIMLLRGLLDTDGWVEKFGSTRFSCVSKKLSYQVRDLARSLGASATINTKKTTYSYNGKKQSGKLAYVVNICHDNPKELFSVREKKERVINGRERKKRLVIASIKKVSHEICQCISVTHPSKLYVTDDYIVTHNTAVSVNILVNAAKFLNKDVENEKDKRAVGFFSLEMSADQLTARILSMECSISATKFRTGNLSESEWEVIATRSGEASKLPIFIDDTPALSISAIRTRVRRMVRKHNLSFLIIDYLQLVRGSGGKSSESRVQEVSEITQGLKAIAKEFNLPVIALSQLSRAVEQREDKRPQLSDLRESGSIEQDADVVAFIYRDSYYHERKKPPENDPKYQEWAQKMNEVRHLSEVIIAKQRNGPVGSVHLFFDAEFTRFGNLEVYHEE